MKEGRREKGREREREGKEGEKITEIGKTNWKKGKN